VRGVALIALAALAAPSPAGAQPPAAAPAPASIHPLEVRVIDLAGGLAYLDRGERDGVAVGTRVVLADQRFAVVAASSAGAAIELGKQTVALGARGVAEVSPPRVVTTPPIERLAAPRPLEAYHAQWPAARRPAADQRPREVPLGRDGAPAALRGALFARGELIEPRVGPRVVTGWLGARLSLDPSSAPLGLDADGALMGWAGDGLAGSGASHRRVRVRELRARYGAAADPTVQLGRLRWASGFGGPLDGVRVAAPVAGLGLAAWGGGVPDEITGRPTTDATAFGVEASWQRPDHALRPRASLAVLGTTFDGELDERKALATLSLDGARLAAAAHVEVASFPGGDPWDARAVEVAGFGADARVRLGGGYLAVHGGGRRPERSRRLAALLPAEWLCRPSPRPPGQPEPCAGAPLRGEAGVAGGWIDGRARLDAGVTGYHLSGADLRAEASGFASLAVERLPLGTWLDLDLDGGRIDFLDWVGGGVGLSGAPHDRLEVGARYRATLLRYDASVAAAVEQRVGLRGALTLAALDLGLDGELVRGAGADAVVGLVQAIWRLP
jgi:hypothetical protein